MRRALVTGATGGLGLALIRTLLAAGYSVRASGRDPGALRRAAEMGAQARAAELTAEGAPEALCRGMDVVFHAAALSSPWGSRERFRAINVVATEALIGAAREAGCDAFVFVSSPSIYTRRRDQLGLTEADPPAARPVNAYAATKGEAERRVLAANSASFATVAIRPRAIVGPDDRVLLPRLLRVLRRGRFPLLRGGRAQVELTDVRDAAEALVAADRNRAIAAGRAFNVSGGRPISVHTLAERLAEEMGLQVRPVALPLGLALSGARVAEALCAVLPGRPEPPVTVYTLISLAYSQTFDLTAAGLTLGWRPRYDALGTAMACARAARVL